MLPGLISLFQSFQVNLEAKSMKDACDKMNRSLAIAPYILAFSGNARFLNCQDTQIQDARMISWERSNRGEGKVKAVNFNPRESAIGGRVEGNQHGTRNVQ